MGSKVRRGTPEVKFNSFKYSFDNGIKSQMNSFKYSFDNISSSGMSPSSWVGLLIQLICCQSALRTRSKAILAGAILAGVECSFS